MYRQNEVEAQSNPLQVERVLLEQTLLEWVLLWFVQNPFKQSLLQQNPLQVERVLLEQTLLEWVLNEPQQPSAIWRAWLRVEKQDVMIGPEQPARPTDTTKASGKYAREHSYRLKKTRIEKKSHEKTRGEDTSAK